MDASGTLRDLFKHMEWADALVWKEAMARREALEDSNLRERLYHIHMVQAAFMQVWKNEPQRLAEAEDFPDGASLLSWTRENYSKLNEYLRGLDEMDSERPIVVPWIERFEARMGRKADAPTLYETMLQVAMHSSYHRGQVNTRLRALNCEPPLTDFIAWIWNGKPEPAWP